MSTTTKTIIYDVTGYDQKQGLTTIKLTCNSFDQRGLYMADFQINDYEMNWYYKAIGWADRYSSFSDFWTGATDKERQDFLFLMATDERHIVARSIQSKLKESTPKTTTARIIKMFKRIAS